ncbi:phage tail tube protein [Rhizobium sp. CFBP 8762]|uniref:phage tail tube protein n=1 Tax=Rhizobium sp. CFBP 8762 TaxID=2775279 RepID=UPI00177D3C91|nr:phage tail tube protein [Rhizobium sp. CFBP 8762]MBD8555554.1 phage tail tube protein [Rhizobium sp. CFBP 8762]
MANNDYGGRITMRLSTGESFSLRGTLNLNTSGLSSEAVVNQDGSVDRTGTPQARRFEITFADRGINLDKLMSAPRFNVTFDEEFTGVTHYFTSAFLTGDPQINRMTGEVSGLTGSAENYNRRDN